MNTKCDVLKNDFVVTTVSVKRFTRKLMNEYVRENSDMFPVDVNMFKTKTYLETAADFIVDSDSLLISFYDT